jgi:SAM-dependent methyltransferase
MFSEQEPWCIISGLDRDPLAPVAEVMNRHGAQCSAAQFHAAVNTIFHRYESEHYDELHRDMWESIPPQVSLLARDCLSDSPNLESLDVLDVGCGTGLATDSLLRSPLGDRVGRVDLLDTSPEMLARAKARRGKWNRPGDEWEGTLESIPTDRQYGLVITCSVLHHIPDIGGFLQCVQRLQQSKRGHAWFLHLQDPNGDFLDDQQLRQRTEEATRKAVPAWAERLKPGRILGRLLREVKGEQGQDYLSKTNRELMTAGLVTTPLTIAEIFTITDIHVQDREGISITRMRSWLRDYDLLAQRSYGFFGDLATTLPPRFRATEEQLIQDGALNGAFASAAWKLRA